MKCFNNLMFSKFTVFYCIFKYNIPVYVYCRNSTVSFVSPKVFWKFIHSKMDILKYSLDKYRPQALIINKSSEDMDILT